MLVGERPSGNYSNYHRTHCDLLPYICDDYSPNIQLYFRIISLCKSLVNSANTISRLCYAQAVSGSGSSVSNSMSVISSLWAVPREYIFKIYRNSKAICSYNEDLIIRASVIRDLLHMRNINKYNVNIAPLNSDEINYMLMILCTD